MEAEALSIHTGRDILLDRLSFAVNPAEVLSITGAAGSGKTLLLRTLAGLPAPGAWIEGEVRAQGRRLLVTQDGALTPHLTLGAQFAELLAHHLGLDERAARQRAVAALEHLHVSAAARRLALYPHELSEPMRWRAVLALALAAEPTVLLADAPAASLDPTLRARLLDELAGWARETGAALVLSGRPEDGVTGPATRALNLDRGRLTESTPPTETAVNGEAPPPGPPILSVRELRVAFPLGRTWRGEDRWLTVVDGLSFGLAEGEILTLLGESGSGKSVLARAVLRLVPPAGGQVAWMARDLATAPPEAMRRARRDLQMLFPDPAAALDPGQTIGAQFDETLEALRPDIPAAGRARVIGDTLREVGLPDSVLTRFPATLAPLEAARAGLARALLPGPRLLVCDEPAATLSGVERETFLTLLLELRRTRRLSLLHATQDADTGLRLGHRALVLLSGRVVEEADCATLAADARHPYSRALIAAAEARRPALHGDPPSALRPPSGCPLRLRCPRARDYCAQAIPPLDEVSPGHRVACHYWDTNGSDAA
nr:oligopeptide/dipeptide ABC transporter ATP-binding protein [Azospirillum soli]